VALELGLRGAVYHRGRRAGARETTAHLNGHHLVREEPQAPRLDLQGGCAGRGAEGHLLREDFVAPSSSSRGTRSAAGGATFYTTGMERSPTSATGAGWERTPSHPVQGAAREALRRVE
jgi:hypothetical protein